MRVINSLPKKDSRIMIANSLMRNADFEHKKEDQGIFFRIMANLFMFLFFIFAFMYYFISNYFTNIRLVFLVISGTLGYICYLNNKKINLYPIGYLLLLISSWMICYLAKPLYHYEFTKLICSVMYIGVALILIENKQNLKIYIAFFYIAIGVLLFRLYVMRIPINVFMADGSSYNFISVICLFLVSTYNIVRIQNGKDFSIVSIVIYFIITVTGYGRGGLLSGILMLLGMIVIMYLKKNKLSKLMILLFTLIFLACIYKYLDSIVSYVFYQTELLGKFKIRGINSNIRLLYWKIFLSNNFSSVSNLFFGSNPYLAREIDGNLHNSFLQMYSAFGLVFFVTNIIIIFKAIRKNYLDHNISNLLFFIVLLVRSFTDRVMFHGINECIFYYFIFLFLLNKNSSKYASPDEKT